jgi:hypothetical protein
MQCAHGSICKLNAIRNCGDRQVKLLTILLTVNIGHSSVAFHGPANLFGPWTARASTDTHRLAHPQTRSRQSAATPRASS